MYLKDHTDSRHYVDILPCPVCLTKDKLVLKTRKVDHYMDNTMLHCGSERCTYEVHTEAETLVYGIIQWNRIISNLKPHDYTLERIQYIDFYIQENDISVLQKYLNANELDITTKVYLFENYLKDKVLKCSQCDAGVSDIPVFSIDSNGTMKLSCDNPECHNTIGKPIDVTSNSLETLVGTWNDIHSCAYIHDVNWFKENTQWRRIEPAPEFKREWITRQRLFDIDNRYIRIDGPNIIEMTLDMSGSLDMGTNCLFLEFSGVSDHILIQIFKRGVLGSKELLAYTSIPRLIVTNENINALFWYIFKRRDYQYVGYDGRPAYFPELKVEYYTKDFGLDLEKTVLDYTTE